MLVVFVQYRHIVIDANFPGRIFQGIQEPCLLGDIDRGLFSISDRGASFDDMFMKFWIYMSFCVLNLTKGGDIFKNYFWRAKI